jgi:uncharacterized membrane protein
MRSLAAPAILSRQASRGGGWGNGLDFDRTGFQWMGRPLYSTILGLLAASEGVGNKVPGAPARTKPLSLLVRAGSGALVGGAIYAGEEEPPVLGAVIGACAAVSMAFIAYAVRKKIAQDERISDKAVGVGEDLLVAALGAGLLRKSAR